MKSISILILLLFCFLLNAHSQDEHSRNGEGFDSIFQHLKRGDFQGEVSGVLNLKKTSDESRKIYFSKEKGLLHIEPDPEEIYDVSQKKYICTNAMDNVSIKYTTYGLANAFELGIDKITYEISLIDGACDLVIRQIEYVYKQTDSQEILYLFFIGSVGLSQQYTSTDPVYYILPGSFLTFTIKKTKSE